MDLYFATFLTHNLCESSAYAHGEPGPVGTIKVAVFTSAVLSSCAPTARSHNFSFTPAGSTFVEFDSTAEMERVFGVLSQGGQVLMPLDNYGFSQRFGWINDRFGVSWQLNRAA